MNNNHRLAIVRDYVERSHSLFPGHDFRTMYENGINNMNEEQYNRVELKMKDIIKRELMDGRTNTELMPFSNIEMDTFIENNLDRITHAVLIVVVEYNEDVDSDSDLIEHLAWSYILSLICLCRNGERCMHCMHNNLIIRRRI